MKVILSVYCWLSIKTKSYSYCAAFQVMTGLGWWSPMCPGGQHDNWQLNGSSQILYAVIPTNTNIHQQGTNAGHNYKAEMLSWKAVTEKGWGVIKSNQMKITSYCDALHKRGNMILEHVSRIISKTNTTDFISEYSIRKILRKILCLVSAAHTSRMMLSN